MGKYDKLARDFLKENKTDGLLDPIVKGCLLLYCALLFAVPLSVGRLPLLTPEQIIFIVLTYAVFVGKGVGFLKDVAPLVILFFAYEAMRGVILQGDESIITQYWSAAETTNGLVVNATPSMANVGDAIKIQVRDANANVKNVDISISRIGGYRATEIKNLSLLNDGINYSLDASDSSKIFEGGGAYNITASASSNPAINGSVAVGITQNVNYAEPLNLEKSLFGIIPSAYLQEHLFTEGQISPIDIISVLAYCMHFLIPFGFACLVWFKDRGLYKKYAATFLLLTYTSLITFLLYPAAPPWMASLAGYTSGIRKIYDETSRVLHLVLLPTIYYWLNANEVAAMPSLHAAYPLLVAIFSTKIWKRWGWLVFIYPILTAFSLVYLGEHYGIDVIAGFAYVLASLFIVDAIFKREKSKGNNPGRK
jgi:membrane-associated phospholipid phosphatase